MTITNNKNLPAGIVKACTIEKHNAPGCLSATTLLKGTKQVILEERHWEELEDDVSDRIWAIFGTTAHKLLETEGENEFTEVDVKTKVGDITVTGRIDNYDMKRGIITDWKTASVWRVIHCNFTDWERQGKIYAWLLSKNGFQVNKCRFIALLKDHSKSKARYDKFYPQNETFVYDFEVSDSVIAEGEMLARSAVCAYAACGMLPDDKIPPCSASERWEKPAKYAVMKQGRKRAVRVFENENEAVSLLSTIGANHYIEKRQGANRRCEDYCLVYKFCDFYKNEVEPLLKGKDL